MRITTIVFPIQGQNVFLANKKDGFGVGFLNGYGGKQKPIDTTIDDTAIRELEEEAGAVASKRDLEKVAVIDFFEGEVHLYECHIYFCRRWAGDLRETEEMGFPELHSMSNMPFDRMWHADKTWIPLVFSGQKIRAKSHYDTGMKKQVCFEYEPLKEVA